MNISLKEKAIVLKLDSESFNLKPLLQFVEHGFTNIKYISNAMVINNSVNELIKKKYLLKWSYKLYYKKHKSESVIKFNQILKSLHLPLCIIITNDKQISQMTSISINHLGSNELSIACNQFHSQILKHLKIVLLPLVINTNTNRSLKIKIKTKNDLLILQRVLSYSKISNISVKFITHGLNFNQLINNENDEDIIYKNKLEKSFKILSINDYSSNREIKSNYKKMLRKYHPDKVYNQNEETINLYTKRFQIIQEAYELVQEHLKAA